MAQKLRRSSLPRGMLPGPGRLGRRELVLTLLGIGLVYFVYTSSWVSHHHRQQQQAQPHRHPDPESVRLERYMNAHQEKKIWDVRKSFDWSSVKHRFPPGPDLPLPKGRRADLPRVQAKFPAAEEWAAFELREARRREVRELFRKNWRSYRERAWMRDALLPVSGAGRDQFSGWAATLVDSLDTLWIMGLRAEFNEAVDAVAGIDFGSSTSPRVNMFETNIRYLGGLLAAYDLSRRSVLLAKAVELGDMLYAGFNTENRMPVDFFDMEASKTGEGLPVEGGVVSASPGTLMLEFTRLSQVTGDPKYYTAVARVVSVFEQGQAKTLIPGLWPTMVHMNTMDIVEGTAFTLGSGADSLYEYVTKMYPMLAGGDARYKTMSVAWMEAADRHMLYRPMLPDQNDLLFSGNADVRADGSVHLDPESEHLSCFLGGTYALGGRLFGRPDLVDVGERLAWGCAYAYKIMPTGMMPERFNLVRCESRKSCPWSDEAWRNETAKRLEFREDLPRGFTTCKDPRYILRPEAIESVFYMYRITGRREFQQVAWDMFAAVGNGTETEFGSAAVRDVTSRQTPLDKEDYQESFWLAETLKYFYLALSPPDLISLDEFVLNTEAHPFRIPR